MSLALAAIVSFLNISYVEGSGAGWVYDYKYLGRDWGSIHGPGTNYCGDGEHQSPINLMTPIGSYGWAYGEPVPKASDQTTKKYTDVFDNVKVMWATNTIKVNLPPVEADANYFTSMLAVDKLKAATTKFSGVQFHFHTPSEHTVDGKYYDLEMHTVHLAENWNDTEKIKYAAVGLFFSVEDYDQSITVAENTTFQRFFENMKWDADGEPVVDLVTYGQVMDLANFEDRWIYKGSVTTPPCDKYVYWNVIRRIHPIKIQVFNQFKEKMQQNKGLIGNT